MPAPQKETIDKGEREVRTKYFQEFKGVYTKASRNAIPQDHFYDLQNLMPIGAANLHTVPGPLLIQTVTGDTIYFSVFATLQSVDYLYLMGTSGKIYQYNINSPALTTINPSTLMGGTQTRMDQWKNSQILFIDTTGYYSWDGTTFTQLTGGIIPTGTLTNPDIAVFSNHVWIYANRALYIGGINDYTATTGTGGYLVANGATVALLVDPQMRGQLVRMVSASGYLYLFFKSSIFIISDVYIPTSASPPAAVYSQINVQAQIGTDQYRAIFINDRNVIFGSKYGLMSLSGVDNTRLSDDIDGTLQFIDPTFPISGGLVQVNNILNSALYFKTTGDPVFGTRYTVALHFDDKWWFSSTSPIAGQQYAFVSQGLAGNVPALFGFINTNGNSYVYQLFANVNTPDASSWQTALWPMEDILSRKEVLRAGFEVSYINNTQGAAVFTLNIDTETRSTPIPFSSAVGAVNWVNNSGANVIWQNAAFTTVVWQNSGYALYFGDGQGAFGRYVGFSGTASQYTQYELDTYMMDYILRTRWT